MIHPIHGQNIDSFPLQEYVRIDAAAIGASSLVA